ncbi:MAG: 4'-phosphopantetheinyl transferase superfamily protein [Oscillospiraceae bacterium]|nr:4'-phosphopantetheinyl transferase superfamily protein [Oscillospiraceae bacterium]
MPEENHTLLHTDLQLSDISIFRIYETITDEPPLAFIYLCSGIDEIEQGYIDRNLTRLPAVRREKCLRYMFLKDRAACLLSYLMLQDALANHYASINTIDFDINEHGKPYLSDNKDVFFSISHTKNIVAVAVADFEIGLDIEATRDAGTSLIEMVASPSEQETIKTASDKQTAFMRLWTMKESYAKAHGISVASILKKDIPNDGFLFLDSRSYHMAVYLGRR